MSGASLSETMPRTSHCSKKVQALVSLLVGFGVGVVLLSARQSQPYPAAQASVDMIGVQTGLPRLAPTRLGSFASQQQQHLGSFASQQQHLGSMTAGRDVRLVPRGSIIAQAAEVLGQIKINIEAGKANPSPPVGPILGAKGLNIMAFCKEYNALTKDKKGVVPVEITYFKDKSFTLALKTPPASKLVMKAAGIDKGASNIKKDKIGSVALDDVIEIAKVKLPDLNTRELEAATEQIKGTCKGMGVTVNE